MEQKIKDLVGQQVEIGDVVTYGTKGRTQIYMLHSVTPYDDEEHKNVNGEWKWVPIVSNKVMLRGWSKYRTYTKGRFEEVTHSYLTRIYYPEYIVKVDNFFRVFDNTDWRFRDMQRWASRYRFPNVPVPNFS